MNLYLNEYTVYTYIQQKKLNPTLLKTEVSKWKLFLLPQ